VIEVVSDDAASRVRDYDDKRRDYAAAGVPEYWIVDPSACRVLVLALSENGYAVAADCGLTDDVSSRVLPGFTVAVAAVLLKD